MKTLGPIEDLEAEIAAILLENTIHVGAFSEAQVLITLVFTYVFYIWECKFSLIACKPNKCIILTVCVHVFTFEICIQMKHRAKIHIKRYGYPYWASLKRCTGLFKSIYKVCSQYWHDWQMKELPVDTPENPWCIEEAELSRRKDLRSSHLIFSIDPKGCEDVDDTLSVRWALEKKLLSRNIFPFIIRSDEWVNLVKPKLD